MGKNDQHMSHSAVAIPEKLFFKIGEVCELAGVQAHVLRYWESEFPMLAPQKNRAGQRVYRKRDVEMALRIKDLLYEDQYTIAGAKKRLANELRAGGKLKVVAGEEHDGDTPQENAWSSATTSAKKTSLSTGHSQINGYRTTEERTAIKRIASELRDLLSMLEKETKASIAPKKR
jgi:DNA-binding transcriptional MerR regulator